MPVSRAEQVSSRSIHALQIQVSAELDARGILSQLRAGKIIAIVSSNKLRLLNLRSRVAALKSAEDKILNAVDLLGTYQALSCGIAKSPDEVPNYTLSLKLGAPRKPMTFAVVISEDEAETNEQSRT